MRPALSEAASEAAYVWQLMGGWYPERLQGLLLMGLEIEHADGLLERLLAIRGAMIESDG